MIVSLHLILLISFANLSFGFINNNLAINRHNIFQSQHYATKVTTTTTTTDLEKNGLDWNFLDGAYLITTTAKNNERLDKTREELESVQLWNKVKVRTFQPDDEDRVRGCYTSHIKILQEIQKEYKNKKQYQILILEDNLEKTLQIRPSTIESINNFLSNAKMNNIAWDVFHLAYMMYVPNLSVSKLTETEGGKEQWSKNIVHIFAGNGSSIGTSAYVISKSGVEAILTQHKKYGYKEAIPNIMASLFPDTRFAAYPMIFHRAAKIGSLVNPQLDDFRKVMFSPIMYSTWESLVVFTGLQTNQLFPLLFGSLTITVLSSLYSILSSLWINSDSSSTMIQSSATTAEPLTLLALVPLGIAIWGATLFSSNRGFAPSAQKK